MLCIVPLFCFYWWDVSDWGKQAAIVEPIHPFERFPFDGSHGFPWAQPVDDLGFVEAVYGFSQGVVRCPAGDVYIAGRDRNHRRSQPKVQCLPGPISRYSEWTNIARHGPSDE